MASKRFEKLVTRIRAAKQKRNASMDEHAKTETAQRGAA
jgi:hypothetical protein